MMQASEKAELRKVIEAAGKELLAYWPGSAGGTQELGAKQKSDGSFVSEADLASNTILLAGLKRLFPKDPVHSEEIVPGPEIAQAERLWIIDPLDGTGVFLQGKDEFCILLALLIKGYPEFGVMYFPARGLYLEAARGEGAFCNGEPLHVSRSEKLRANSVYCRLSELSQKELMYPQHLDSGHAFLKLASGEIQGLVLRLSKLREWDLAAPTIVLEEAGGRASDVERQRVSYLPGGLPELFVASNGLCHEEILAQISERSF